MTQFVNNDVSSGATVYASDHNTQGALVAAVVNGGLENENIKAGAAIDGSKLASNSVTSSQINFGGSGSGVWWEEIARTTLGVAGNTITISSIPARKYLYIYAFCTPTGGTISTFLQFNGDSGNNYAARTSENGAADSTSVSQSSIQVGPLTASNPQFISAEIVNVANQEKIFMSANARAGTAGAGNAPDRRETYGKWANTTNQISSVAITNSGTGNYAIGSELIVLGHN